MEWEIEATDDFRDWYFGLDAADTRSVNAAVDFLGAGGPGLGRPMVDTVKGSHVPNMKELRPKRSDIRILFVFDPRRACVLLVGGSKTNNWQGWYERNIPVAERLYAEYLAELRKEGLL